MLDQRVNAKVFLRMTSLKDIIKYRLGRNKDEYLDNFQGAIDLVNSHTHQFDDLQVHMIKGKAVYEVKTLASLYYCRHINNLLRRLYKIKQSDRDVITKQIHSLLKDTSPFFVIKGDITNFYESIDRSNIIQKLKDDRLLDLRHINVIEKIFSNYNNDKGIPRGISFSSTLSELYLREFDDLIRRMPGIYYYARYVDDFIIFAHDECIDIDCVQKELSKFGLCINKTKTHKFISHLFYAKKQDITFLGYNHVVQNDSEVVVKISKKGLEKLKQELFLHFLIF